MRLGLSANEAYLLILAGLVLFSAAATAYGQWLLGHASDGAKQQRIAIVNSRVRASWSLILIFAVAFALGQPGLLVVFAFSSFLALREFIALTPTKASDHWALVIAFYAVIPIQYLLIGFDQYQIFSLFIPVYVFLLLPVLMALRQDTERYLERVAKVQWGLMISVFCVSHAGAIMALEVPRFQSSGQLLLLFFLLVVYFSDLLEVMASALLGGTPLRSNANKTRKGVFAGGLGAVLIGASLWWLTPFRFWQAILMSGAIVVAGFMGGLVLSSVKRSLGARRWDTEIVLTRGALDRLDSLIFAAPVFYQLTVFFFL
ncbi:MAG TPA: phosphatidate cytidylyltransferase [Burkholderiaceae bacterium]|jgi:phosphatidate cytidylyltransferase|nr:phosphatidate cytidylyltransferase [Burkholderiaceae bacterium]HPE01034.1 phosphatidate cytidylyltransferase [Burkholderiaceae bacterium]HRZ01192.1 phosphatidate cytidylyltransferase [Burkholderiaceae bacterium]